MNTFVKLYDTVTITPSSIDSFAKTVLKDNVYMPPQGKSLCVDIVATHAARLTRNHGFYLPQRMRDGVSSLLDNYGKPILVHHNSHQDPIGRVIDAKYVDTSLNFTRDSAIEGVIKDLCEPKIPFIRSLDLIDRLADSGLLSDPSYPGLGHIVAKGLISDKEAIEKVLDERYLTVSIGASTDKAICSICKQDWAEDGACDHRPGKSYEDQLTYLIAGKLIYDEISFVNAPADTLAKVISINNSTMQDSVIAEQSQQVCNVNASFYFTDLDVGGASMKNLQEAWGKLTKLVALEDTKKEDKVSALKDFVAEFGKEEDDCIKEAKDKLAELEKPEPIVEDEKTEEPVVNPISTDQELLDAADEHYKELIDFGYELSLFDEDFEDAKLSTEKRKSLPKATFCKPSERKYPVNDCNHAKVAMAYAKKHNESASVVSCIRRKAKALGCPFNGKKDAFDEFEADLDTILTDLANREAQTSNSEIVEDTKDTESDNTEDEIECEDCKAYHDKLQALRQELKDIYDEYSCMQQANLDEILNTKQQLADALVTLSQLSGKEIKDKEQAVTNMTSLPLVDLCKEATVLKDNINLEDMMSKLNDGMARVPEGIVEDPTISDEAAENPTEEKDEYQKYRDTYQATLNKNGFQAARDYFIGIVRAGLVPGDFDPEKEEALNG